MKTSLFVIIGIVIVGISITLLFIPSNEFFGISSYNPESPSPMMILENDSDDVMKGFKITPVSCSVSDDGLNESHFQITNTHSNDYDVTIGVSFTDNDSILYEKEVIVRILAGQTTDQIHLSDVKYDNPICVVQINDLLEID